MSSGANPSGGSSWDVAVILPVSIGMSMQSTPRSAGIRFDDMATIPSKTMQSFNGTPRGPQRKRPFRGRFRDEMFSEMLKHGAGWRASWTVLLRWFL